MSSDGGTPDISTDQFLEVLIPGIGALKEGFNEISGFNKKREQAYQKRVVSEAEAAKKDLADKENATKGMMDMVASMMGASVRRRSQAKSGGFMDAARSAMSYDTSFGGSQDLLGF